MRNQSFNCLDFVHMHDHGMENIGTIGFEDSRRIRSSRNEVRIERKEGRKEDFFPSAPHLPELMERSGKWGGSRGSKTLILADRLGSPGGNLFGKMIRKANIWENQRVESLSNMDGLRLESFVCLLIALLRWKRCLINTLCLKLPISVWFSGSLVDRLFLSEDRKCDVGQLIGLGNHRCGWLNENVLSGKSCWFQSDVGVHDSTIRSLQIGLVLNQEFISHS